jgi:hypothetical protein
MTVRQINARDLIMEVSDGATSATWTGIGGLTSGAVTLNEGEEIADTTTFDSEGYYSQEKMQLGAKLALEGKLLQDPSTGVRDPGQALVEVHHEKLTYDSVQRIRFRYPGSTTWKVWDCTISVGEQGGETNDKTSWAAEFTRCGAPMTANVT